MMAERDLLCNSVVEVGGDVNQVVKGSDIESEVNRTGQVNSNANHLKKIA